MPHTVVLIISLMYCTLQGSLSEDNRCEERCCTNFIEKEGKCVECIGSFGVNCTLPCPRTHYGGRCIKQCFCDMYEVCHPVYGCCQKSDNKCQHPSYDEFESKDGHANNQRNTSDKATGADQGILTESLTEIILSVAVSILVLCGAVCIWMRIREKGLNVKPELESANTRGEDIASMGHVNEFCYDDIRESQMITDQNCNDAQGIRYSDHLCRHPTTSTGHCQICEMANHDTEQASEDYSKLREGNAYNVLSLLSVPADVEMSCDATYVDENLYSCIDKTSSEKEDPKQETTDKEKKTYHMYHILCKSTAENETGTGPNAKQNNSV